MCRKLPFHYAWIICLCAGLLMFCYIGISGNCFSIYLTYTRSEWSYSNSQISAFNTIRMLSSLLALFSMRRFYRRFSLRTGVTFWCAMLGLSYALCALAARTAFFFLAAAVMGYSGGMGSLAAASMLVRRWFHDRLGLAIGLFSSATGLATVLAPALITRLLESRGLRFTYVATGCFIALIALAVGLLVRSNPAELGMAPYTVASSPDAPRRKAVVTRCRGAITRGEWLFFGAALVLFGIGNAPSLSFFSLHFANCGFDPMQIAAAISVYGISIGISKVIYGFAVDRFGGGRASLSYALVLLTGFAFLSLLKRFPVPALLMMATGFSGFGFPGYSVGISIWPADIDIPENYDETVRRCNLLQAIGGVIGCMFPGPLADRFGSYAPAYAVMFTLFALFWVVLFIMYRRKSYTVRAGQEPSVPEPLSDAAAF